MMTISDPIGAKKAEEYYEKDLALERENYFARGAGVHTAWAGNLANHFGLSGPVDGQHFRRMARGNHPHTNEQLVREVRGTSRGHKNNHRAAWDMTFSAPKSVSITAILGEREEVFDAHRAAVQEALNAVEFYVEARLGGNRGREPTGSLAIACFEHDTARALDDSPDARRDVQLHTHCLAFNMTHAADKIRSVEPREMFRSQKLATAVYRSVLADRLRAAGYEVVVDSKTGAPEIAGYSREYLRAASQRSAQIDHNLAAKRYRRRARSAKVAVRINRAPKRDADPAEIRAAQLELSRQYGDQHRTVINRMLARGPCSHNPAVRAAEAADALDFALADRTSRNATTNLRDVMTVVLRASLGKTGLVEIQEALMRALDCGTVVGLSGPHRSGIEMTTKEMIDLERSCIEMCLAGRGSRSELLTEWDHPPYSHALSDLSAEQRRVFIEIARQRDQVYALQGYAGVGKTRLLRSVAMIAMGNRYKVVGLAPSGVATASLAESGIAAETMQGFLARNRQTPGPRLFVLDESSLASTRMMRDFLGRLRSDDRLLLVGDIAQHESVEAGKIFSQLQAAGLGRSTLGEIRRQQDPQLRAAVEHLTRQDIAAALAALTANQVKQSKWADIRFRDLAQEYAKDPEATCIVAPTHQERRDITEFVREQLACDGRLTNEVVVTALDARNDYTQPALTKAYTYKEGDVVRYRVGSKSLGLPAGSYARVTAVDETHNLLIVTDDDGRAVAYNPARLDGVEIYQERKRAFAAGDRVLVTRGDRKKRIAKNATGWIVSLKGATAKIKLDDGRTTTLDLTAWRHLDHGYVLTSFTSQSLSTSRVLIHVDTSHGEAMINQRFGYVALSRAVHEAVIFTDRSDLLRQTLAREYGNTSALESVGLSDRTYGTAFPQATAEQIRTDVFHAPEQSSIATSVHPQNRKDSTAPTPAPTEPPRDRSRDLGGLAP